MDSGEYGDNYITVERLPYRIPIRQLFLPDFSQNGEMLAVSDDVAGSEDETAFSRYMSDAMFLIPTPQVLQKIVTVLEDLYENDISDLDMQGDLYEYMLGKLSTAGQNGQFRTPRHIIRMMVELMQPGPDDIICDPACGTAGFFGGSNGLHSKTP